jgi:hypothetical protein
MIPRAAPQRRPVETIMDLEITVDGDTTAESDARDLQAWLRREAVTGLRVQPKPGTPTPGHMGVDPVTVLSVVLASEAIIQLVKSLHVWLQTRKPKATVTVKTVAGEVRIDVENLRDQDAFVQRVLSVVHPG